MRVHLHLLCLMGHVVSSLVFLMDSKWFINFSRHISIYFFQNYVKNSFPMKQLLEGKICLCNMLINISPHELRSLATQCNMATVLARASQNLSVCSRSGPVFALSLHSQMKQQRGGKKTTTTKQSRNVSRNLQEL